MFEVKSNQAWKGVSEWNALKCGNKIISELLNGNSPVDFMKRTHRQLDGATNSLSFYWWGIISDYVNVSHQSKDRYCSELWE